MKNFNQNEWYVWEQNCSPCLVCLTLSPSYFPLRDYLGSGSYACIIVFQDGQAKWLFRPEEWKSLGQKIIDYLMCPPYKAKFVEQWAEVRKNLLAKAEQILFTEKIEDEVTEFEELAELFTEFYGLGAFYEFIQSQSEAILKKYVSDNDFKALLATDHKTFAVEIMEDLAKVKDLETAKAHSDKYYWKRNNYYETIYVTPEMVLEEARTFVLPETHDAKKLLDEKAKVYDKLPAYYKGITDLVEFAGWFGDVRKSTIMKANSAFDKLLKILADKTGYDIHEIRLLLHQEVRYFAENPSEYKERFALRKEKFLVSQFDFPMNDDLIEVGEVAEKMYDPFIAEGASKVDEVLAELDPRLNLFEHSDSEVQELKGHSTYGDGIITGTVRVVKNPKAQDINEGEILVTPATTPDYITHIHKSIAIITDYGGHTSHAAIISRELKKPCTIGTHFATSLLKDGDKVSINFETGEIIKCK